jgi:hypothetical protein
MSNRKSRGPRSIPSQVQLPGGVVLKGLPFRIVEYNADGSPRLFELQPAGAPFDIAEDGTCVLFAREELLRNPWPRRAATADGDAPMHIEETNQ